MPGRLRGPGRLTRASAALEWCRRAARAGALLLALGATAPLAAQTPATGSVAGRMVNGKARPIRYAVVTLTRPYSRAATLTDDSGAFRFRDVDAGEYRLRLQLVGFEPDTGAVVRVEPGGRVNLDFMAAPRPLRIAADATPSPVCYPGTMLERNPTLAALWGEARKAGQARRLFDLSHRYTVLLNEELATFRRVPDNIVADSEKTHALDSTPAKARILAGQGSYAGYGVDMDSTRLIAIPEMLEVVDEGFLRQNCIRELRRQGEERRVRFRPLNPDPAGTDLIGNVVLDAHYALRRIEFEYQRSGYAIARGWAEFGDGGLPGGQVPFARRIRVEMLTVARTEGDWIELDPIEMRMGERALAEMKYTDFARDTASSR